MSVGLFVCLSSDTNPIIVYLSTIRIYKTLKWVDFVVVVVVVANVVVVVVVAVVVVSCAYTVFLLSLELASLFECRRGSVRNRCPPLSTLFRHVDFPTLKHD